MTVAVQLHRAQFLVDIADRKDWDKPGRTENESDPVAPRPAAAPPASEIEYVYLSEVIVRPVELNKPLMWAGVPMAVHLDHVIGWTLGGMGVMNNGGWEMMEQVGMEPTYKDDESGNLAQVLRGAAEWSGISPPPE
jgi:hypothetical protein